MRFSFLPKTPVATFLFLLIFFPAIPPVGASDAPKDVDYPAVNSFDPASFTETIPPVISISNIEDGAIYDRDVTPRIVIRSRDLKSSSSKLDGATYLEGVPISTEGNHTLIVSADDENGGTSTVTKAFVIDKTPPTTSFSINGSYQTESGSHYVRSDAKIVVTATDPGRGSSGISRTECQFDGGQYTDYKTPLNLGGLEEGSHTLFCVSYDRAGNVGGERKLFFTVSNSPPTTMITLSPPKKLLSDGGFIASPATVFSLFASGAPSGVARSEYQIDGGPWNEYAPFTIPESGQHTIRYKSTDRLGHEETAKSLSVTIDEKPPSTELRVSTPQFQGTQNTLYVAPTTVFTLSAASPVIGVAKVEYRLDNGRWITYEPFTITGEGRHLVEFRGIDAVGNMETPRTKYLMVDATPPVTTISAGGQKINPALSFFSRGATTFSLAATDKLSGVKLTEYRIGDGPWTRYAPIEFTGQGDRTIEFRSIDNVDNSEEPQVLSVIIDTDPPVSVLQPGNPHVEREKTIFASERTLFTINASDPLSGVVKTEYRVDDGGWRAYAPFTVVAGHHTVEFRSTDKVGNQESAKSVQVFVDDSPPETTITMGGKKISADPLFTKGDLPLQLLATSPVWGVKGTEYRVDGGEWMTYTGKIPLKDEGRYLLEYKSTDNGGKEEELHAVTVVVDRTPPVSSITIGTPQQSVEGTVRVETGTLLSPTATDELSGVERVEYQLKGQPVETDGVPFSLAATGSYDLSYWSVDRTGNREKPHHLKIVVTDPPKRFSPEDLLLANEIATPKTEPAQPPVQMAEADAKPTTPPAVLPEPPPEEPVQPVIIRQPKEKKFLTWMMEVLQVILIVGVMAF